MKVVLLSPGRSSHTHKWAMYYKQQGMDVTVITFKDHYSEANAREVRTLSLPKLLPGKLSYIAAVFALKKILRELKPDILHGHFVSSYGFIGALSGYHPFYVSVWGTDIYQFPQKSSLNRKIVEFTLGKADTICSTSHIMAEETKRYTNKPVEVTPFGVDLSLFSPKEERKEAAGPYKIGIAKGLEDVYGFKDLFQACALLKDSFPGLTLEVIGDGPKYDEYKEICASLGIDARFIGRIPNTQVPNYIRDMDLVVLPSHEESFGVTAVEAMACGVPVVVSDADGLKEVVLDGKTGLIVPRHASEKLAEGISRLLNDPVLRQEMGRNGVEHVRTNYDWNENAGRMITLYNQSIAAGN